MLDYVTILSFQMFLLAGGEVNPSFPELKVSCSLPVYNKGFGDGSSNNTAAIECDILCKYQ